jgi:hypothetical protein
MMVGAAFAWAVAAPPSPASDVPPSKDVRAHEEERRSHERAFLDAYIQKDWPAAEDALLKWIAVDGQNFVPYYNLACILGQQGRLEEAERMLRSAVTRGFADRVRLTTDPDLAPLRTSEEYHAIIDGWERIVSAQVERRLERARQTYPESMGYTYERDETGRLAYISAFDPEMFLFAKGQIGRLGLWWETQVLPSEEPWRTGKLPPAESWVIVILPTREDYQRWAASAYGEGWERIGGEYSHDQRRLIAMDIGSTLRHEYWHVLHWRHMERLGQRHPAWVMEGLCSLVEDVKEGPNGEMVPVPSWRTNMTKKASRAGTLAPLETLFALDQGKFLTQRPLAQYAHARSLFMFVMAQGSGKLREWYTAYVKGFSEDPTGKAAFETVFKKPLKEIDRDFRKWLKDVPEVAERIRPGMANLPFSVDMGTGDGVVVTSIPGAKGGGIRMRDVVTAIDGKAVRDLYEYARILAEYKPGVEVEVAYKKLVAGGKDTEHVVTKVRLIREPG